MTKDRADMRGTRHTKEAARCVLVLAAVVFLAAFLAGGPLVAQDLSATARERFRLIQEDKSVKAADAEFLRLEQSGDRDLDIGGWSTTTYLDLTNDDHRRAVADLLESVTIEDYRFWVAAGLHKGRKVDVKSYARGRVLDVHFDTAPGVVAPDTRSQEGLELDLGYVDVTGTSGFSARAGRQFVRVGRGLTLALDLDGLDLAKARPSWTYRVFGGETVPRDPNIDTSVVGFARRTQRRAFVLGEVEHRTDSGAKYYGYVVVERDSSRSLDPAQRRRNFSYDTEYYGGGTAGRFNPLLHYFLEVIHQSGEVLIDVPTDPRVSIDGTGLLSGLLYYPKWRWRPLASLEYSLGSGDPRRGSVTNVFGGKQTITRDENFLYFGAFDGGLALSPRLSNLHVLRAGYQVKPLPAKDDQELPDLLIGTKGTLYWKDDVNGVISDPLAILASHDIGTAIDVFLAWRPFSDASMLVQYGRFIPGDAYMSGANDPSERLLAAGTLSF
jgi:hypothetical protein